MSDIPEIKQKLKEHEVRISELERILQRTKKPVTTGKTISMREFILDKNPQNDIHRALAIGYYLEKYRGFTSFTSKEIEKGFAKAREKVPSNVPDKIAKNRDNDHMMKMDEKKDNKTAYALTNRGTIFVDNNFIEDE